MQRTCSASCWWTSRRRAAVSPSRPWDPGANGGPVPAQCWPCRCAASMLACASYRNATTVQPCWNANSWWLQGILQWSAAVFHQDGHPLNARRNVLGNTAAGSQAMAVHGAWRCSCIPAAQSPDAASRRPPAAAGPAAAPPHARRRLRHAAPPQRPAALPRTAACTQKRRSSRHAPGFL